VIDGETPALASTTCAARLSDSGVDRAVRAEEGATDHASVRIMLAK
jgi:hypothetical protein